MRGDLSKSDFARRIGVSPPVYQRYEEGRVPRASNLSAIAERCGVTIEYLLGDNPGLAAHASGFNRETQIRDRAPVSYGNSTATPLQSQCRYPKDCDLVQELAAQRSAQADVQAQLAILSTQVETLTRLLGATLAASANGVAHEKQKAG